MYLIHDYIILYFVKPVPVPSLVSLCMYKAEECDFTDSFTGFKLFNFHSYKKI